MEQIGLRSSWCFDALQLSLSVFSSMILVVQELKVTPFTVNGNTHGLPTLGIASVPFGPLIGGPSTVTQQNTDDFGAAIVTTTVTKAAV